MRSTAHRLGALHSCQLPSLQQVCKPCSIVVRGSTLITLAGSALTPVALPSHRYTSGTRRILVAVGKAFLLIFAVTQILRRRKCLRLFRPFTPTLTTGN